MRSLFCEFPSASTSSPCRDEVDVALGAGLFNCVGVGGVYGLRSTTERSGPGNQGLPSHSPPVDLRRCHHEAHARDIVYRVLRQVLAPAGGRASLAPSLTQDRRFPYVRCPQVVELKCNTCVESRDPPAGRQCNVLRKPVRGAAVGVEWCAPLQSADSIAEEQRRHG